MKIKNLILAINKIHKINGTSQPFICGGLVRDKVLNRLSKVADIDLTTGDSSINIIADELYRFLIKEYTVSRETKSDHQTIKFTNLKIDFSSNFIIPNINQFLIKKGITNPTTLQQEMFSRDFTCNSMLLNLDSFNVIDVVGSGIEDTNNKIIRTCLEPEITLLSYNNRVVRAIYLSSKLGFKLDQKIINFVKTHPELIKVARNKTLIDKLNLAIDYDTENTLRLLTDLNVWNYVPVTDKLQPFYEERLKQKKYVTYKTTTSGLF